MKQWIIMIAGVLSILAVLYFMASGAKYLSYKFFYEDYVKNTVTEMVKPEYLNK